ncbi:TadE/TadG family type IV pilus assembly protein [Streptomyces sp. NPDC001985]|uniref:TadE/TadG family type IV pilus assembly protein n=1 Tax=Streptomyces sp. NPDC001985 TaxID=3154406 RepID=UPI003327B7E8
MRSHVRHGGRGAARERPGAAGRWDDRGQVAVEFAGTLPVILATLAVLWQGALIGYTFSLAGNAADAGARAGAVDGPSACDAAVREDLPDAWRVESSCRRGDGLFRATVRISVPILFPGAANFPFDVDAEAAAVDEHPRGALS